MYSLVFTGIAFGTAGAICALVGDLQKHPLRGLFCFLLLNLLIWVRLIASLLGSGDLLESAEHFVLAHVVSASFFLATVHFLDSAADAASDVFAVGRK